MATFRCTLHRLTAKNTNPPPPPVVLTLTGESTERTETFEEFRHGAVDLGETALSLKCEIARNVGGRGYQKQEVFLAIKEAVRLFVLTVALSFGAAGEFAWIPHTQCVLPLPLTQCVLCVFGLLSRREPAGTGRSAWPS